MAKKKVEAKAASKAKTGRATVRAKYKGPDKVQRGKNLEKMVSTTVGKRLEYKGRSKSKTDTKLTGRATVRAMKTDTPQFNKNRLGQNQNSASGKAYEARWQKSLDRGDSPERANSLGMRAARKSAGIRIAEG